MGYSYLLLPLSLYKKLSNNKPALDTRFIFSLTPVFTLVSIYFYSCGRILVMALLSFHYFINLPLESPQATIC